MQVFQRHAVGARRHGRGDRGPARVLAAAPAPTAPGSAGWDELDVRALHDGDEIEPWETVMTIEGDYCAVLPPRDASTWARSRAAR